MWPRVVPDGPTTMKPEVGLIFRGWMLSGRWRSPGPRLIRVRPSLHTDRTYSHHWRQQSAIPLSSRLFHDTGVAVLGGVVVTWSEAHQTVPIGPWRHRSCNMCPDFFPWMQFGRPPLLTRCVYLDVRLYYVAIQNLVYGCGNSPQTTAESSDTPPIHCALHVQHSEYVHPASFKPTMRPCSNGWSCSKGVRTLRRGIVVPYSECCKHCSPLKAPQLLPAESKQRAQRQVPLAPSDRRWRWQMNH